MHDIDRGQRVALRAKLLLGVAGATAAASTAAFADQPTAPPANPQKWAPYSDFGGSVGSGMVGGKLDLFVPVFQNLDSLAFLNLGVGTETKANVLYNIGAGYRTKIDPDWIVGIYAGHDGSQLADNNTFGQTSFSAELMSADWDMRLNGYLADNAPKQVPGASGLYINGTTIAVLDAEDVGYSGFDGEVGYRVFSTDDTDVRVFVGGFHFSHSASDRMSTGEPFDFNYRDMSGAKARAEATVYDLDIIGNQSRLTVDGQIAHDDVRGTTGSVGITLRIPLGSYSGSSGAQALDELDRRMADPVRHNDQVLTRSQYTKPEPVIIYGPHVTSQPTNTLLYVNGSTTPGAGTYANPTTLADATSRHTTNAFIVLNSHGGPIPGGATLQPGQTLVAGGETFTVEGEFSHAKFTHLFDPSTNVTLIPATPGGNVLNLASNTNLYGFTIEGNFGDAIYGKNVDHVNISGVTIDGTGGGHTGIDIRHTVSGAENITIQNVGISNLTEDGIDLIGNISDGGASTETFKLSNVGVTNAGGYGIVIGDTARAGSKITDTISLSNVTVGNAGYGGVQIFAGASGAHSSINQTATLSNVTVTGASYDGIDIGAYAAGGATVTSNQTLSNIAVTNAGYTAIDVFDDTYGAGSVIDQTFSASNVTITGGDTGIQFRTLAAFGATVDQNITLSNATLTDIGNTSFGGVGIAMYAGAYNATVKQYATLSNVSVSYTAGSTYGRGIVIGAFAIYGGHVVQQATLTSVSASHDMIGLQVYADVADYKPTGTTTVDQSVTVTGGTFNDDAEYGVKITANAEYSAFSAHGYQSEAAISQKVTLTNAAMDHDGYGVYIDARARNGASVTQDVTLYNVDISHNSLEGISIAADATYVGFVTQQVALNNAAGSYNEVSYNGDEGIYVSAIASTGGQINQHLYAYNTNIDHNTFEGVNVRNVVDSYYAAPASGVYHYSHLQQNLIFAYGSISHNGGDGLNVSNTVNYGAQIDQIIELYSEKVDHNTGDGFRENSIVTTYGSNYNLPTNLHSDVYIYNSDFSHNTRNGIEITSSLLSPTTPMITIGYSYVEQHITVGNTTANYNTRNGFVATVNDSGVYGDNIQYITLANSTFRHNGQDGAYLSAAQYYGPGSFGDAIQEVTISGSTFNNNARDGLYAYAGASGQQGRAEQHFTISGSDFDNNGRNGATFEAYAHDGVYLTGLGCGHVQGLYGGCAFVRQTVSITGSDFSHNASYGIYAYAHADNYGAVYNSSGRPAYTPTMLIVNSTVDSNGGSGLYVRTKATNDSYVYSYAIAVNSHFDHNGADGIIVESGAYTGSAIVQKTVLYGTGATSSSTVDHNGLYGVYIDSVTKGGAINQTVGIYNSDVSYNGKSGVWVRALANNPTGGTTPGYVADPTVSAISQYVNVDGSTVLGNTGDGVEVTSAANGASSAIYQYLGIVGSTISGNTNDGVRAFQIAYSGASVNQSLYFNGDTIQNNLGDGVYASETAVNQSSATQTVNFGYQTGATTYITGNHGDGIYLGASAFSAGRVTQTTFLYDVDSSYNHGNGLSLGLSANGYGFGSAYIYYSHVSQNLVAAYDSFDHNGLNGVAVSNVTYYGGAANQSLQLISIDASHNTGDGFHETSTMTTIRGNSFSFSTNITTDLYLIGSTFNQNAGNGISISARNNGPVYAPAFFGGYSYQEQTTTITGVTADGNGGAGLLLDARQQGRYGLDEQTVAITGSEFNHNTGSGAKFLSTSYYGPAGFGDTYENINIGTSKFSYNGGNGLQFSAYASGRQGRAEQHVTVTGSYVEHNAGDGVHIYASAVNGTYIAGHPCTAAQGLAGGCAFVRQSVSISGTDISYNTGNGVFVGTYANNYGAIYGKSGRPHAATLNLYGDTITYNGARGVDVSNHATGHSYLYQYLAMIDTHVDHNSSDGVYASSYVGGASTMLQRALLYTYHTGASASYNAGNGFKATIEVLGASYAHDLNIVQGVDLSHNGSFGLDGAIAYADGSSTAKQVNVVYSNTVNYNGDGVGLYSIGAGASQKSYIGSIHYPAGNTVAHNAFVGVYGEANFGAYQYIAVYTTGNNVHNNGTNYLFNSFGGSTQILN